MFYDIYISLCEREGKKPSVVAQELGINKSNVSNWKNNGYTPRGRVLNCIADYFGVSVDYLLTGAHAEQKEKPADNSTGSKRSLRSIARLEGSEISADEDEEIDSLIEWVLRKREKDRK